MPGQIPDPSMTVGSLPGLGPLTGLPSSARTAEELKYADIHNIGAKIAPLHFLEVKLGKRPQPVKSELDEEEEKVPGKEQSGGSQNKKKEQEECLQWESEWLELMNAELKTQMEELKQDWKQLILMLNRHHLTCVVRTDSVKSPDSEGNPLLEQLEKNSPEGGLLCLGPGLQEAGQRLWTGETSNQAAVGISLASPPGHPPKGPMSSQEKP
ncbi:hypothetical protein QTO34_013102 [Cnephaeus nilssonii]|uniref:Jun dimerization protein 2 n=1 Tax=Cnephaeus nilssonii TaxID=3371016 RepID=A0AA40I7C5_CNENI|nr:hypothetical protein QTO34_013102 [Eptesicus nilssonii]